MSSISDIHYLKNILFRMIVIANSFRLITNLLLLEFLRMFRCPQTANTARVNTNSSTNLSLSIAMLLRLELVDYGSLTNIKLSFVIYTQPWMHLYTSL